MTATPSTTSRAPCIGAPLLALLDRYAVRFPQDRDRADDDPSVRRGRTPIASSAPAARATSPARPGSRRPMASRRCWSCIASSARGSSPAAMPTAIPIPPRSPVAKRRRSRGSRALRLIDWWRDGSASPQPFDVDVHRIPARGGDPEHLHLDIRFLMVADPAEPAARERRVGRGALGAAGPHRRFQPRAEPAAHGRAGGRATQRRCYPAGSGR